MNPDRSHLDAMIHDAIEEHAAALDVAVPDFGVLVAVRHRRTRHTLGAATAAVALLGIGGVIVAANRAEAPSNTVSSEGLPADVNNTPDSPPLSAAAEPTTTAIFPLPAPTATTVPDSVSVEYSCTDPIGEDQLGRQLFGSCSPTPGDVDVDGDYACERRIRNEEGFVIFSSCEPVGQLGPIPGNAEDDPFGNPEDIPVQSAPYIVQAGDYGIKIADEFCVTLDDLEAVNGWSDAAGDFPGPGNELLIPRAADVYADGCGAGLYTIVEGDTVRSRVAEMFCVSVETLDRANAETEGYSGFYPGLVIIIPPSSNDTC